MRRRLLIIMLLSCHIQIYGQSQSNKISNPLEEPVSIYEYGENITSCETNFRNLLSNWNTENITNANEYEFVNISFVESISDSIRYIYYRNYFSGGEPVYSSIKSNRGTGFNGSKIYEYYVVPGYIHQEIYDRRLLPDKTKEILSKEFMQQAQKLLELEINIDTLSLIYYSGKISKIDTIKSGSDFFDDFVQKSYLEYNLASTDSISNDYIDFSITRKKNPENINVQKRKALILEDLLIERISKQVSFNKQVHINDKVYLIKFTYLGKTYTDYVICSSCSKKIVIDCFFKNIVMDK